MDESSIWKAVLFVDFSVAIGIWIGIAISGFSEVGLLIFWGIWLISIGGILVRIKNIE